MKLSDVITISLALMVLLLVLILWRSWKDQLQLQMNLNQSLNQVQQNLLNRLMTKTWSEYAQVSQVSPQLPQSYSMMANTDEAELAKSGSTPDLQEQLNLFLAELPYGD